MMVRFHETLSDSSVYFRYFHMIHLRQRVAHERLARVCFIDYDRETALVVERTEAGAPEILAVGRLTKMRSGGAEFAILVSDRAQHQGLGKELLRRLLEIARDEGIGRVMGNILPENRAMEEVCRKLGFHVNYDHDEGVLQAQIDTCT